jgi:hypothetical protein
MTLNRTQIGPRPRRRTRFCVIRLTIGTIGVVSLIGALSRSGWAQETARLTLARGEMSEEQVVAMHSCPQARDTGEAYSGRSKREGRVRLVQLGPGAGCRPYRSRTGVQLISSTREHWHGGSTVLFRTASFNDQRESGGTRSIAEHRPD